MVDLEHIVCAVSGNVRDQDVHKLRGSKLSILG